MMKNKTRSMVYRYKNPEGLQGQRALVRNDPDNDRNFLCQFDNLDLTIDGINLAHGWHSFPKSAFKYVQARTR